MPSSSLARRFAVIGLGCALTAGVLAGAAPVAQADDSTTLTVLGTSDVSDSFLVQSVIKPGFERAHPGVTLNYIGNASGQAIINAEAGQGSALIVHAQSLENQFVSDGFSLNGAGKAVMYGDFVLAGPANDPAGVLNGSTHDIATAFEKIAAAGAAGKATFVSRGDTSGTTVSEHSIWPLTTGVTTCTVSTTNGGGTTPSTTGGDCPATVTPPSWYAVTGDKQGANVQAADTCAKGTFPNGGCYVYTDRGTFEYLQSQALLKTLQVVVRDNDASARGGSTALTNSFHAYAVNPAKFAGNSNVHLNPTLANEFLSYLTLPSTQANIGAYLANAQGGAPFLPDASPLITASAPAKAVKAGQKITITGTVRNVVPGTPVLSGVTVSLKATPQVTGSRAGAYIAATAKTDASGKYTLSYPAGGRATYTVTTGSITKVERPDLSPTFSDVLSPATSATSGAVTVQSKTSLSKLKAGNGKITGTAKLLPVDKYKTGQLQLFAAKYAKKMPTLKLISALPLAIAQGTVNYKYYLPKGKWYYQLHYVNNGVVLASASGVHLTTVH
jgi:tungstate transport system substrate-binding protein